MKWKIVAAPLKRGMSSLGTIIFYKHILNWSKTMKIGDTIEFRYYGGSDWGGKRKVKITEETAKFWSGIDLETGQYKKYFKTKMKDAIVVIDNSFDESRLELEKFLNRNQYFGVKLLSSLVEEFNDKWKVDYEFKDKKLVEKPKTIYKKVMFDAELNAKTGSIIIKIAHNLKLKIDKYNYLYINDAYFCNKTGLYNQVVQK